MNNIRKDVRQLISLNERIQSALLQGESFNSDETILIRQCATELLETMLTPNANDHTVRET
jgi:hypothetical protein